MYELCLNTQSSKQDIRWDSDSDSDEIPFNRSTHKFKTILLIQISLIWKLAHLILKETFLQRLT